MKPVPSLLAKSWLAAAIVMAFACSDAGNDHGTSRDVPAEHPAPESFEQRVVDFFAVDVRRDGDEVVLDPVTRILASRYDLMCGELDDDKLFSQKLAIGVMCRGKQDASWAATAVSGEPVAPEHADPFRNPALEAALVETRARFSRALAAEPDLVHDRKRMFAVANRIYDDVLIETGVVQALQEIWTEHVVARSDCFENMWQLMHEQFETLRRQARASGLCERRWKLGLGVCTSDSRQLAGHIVVKLDVLSPEQQAAVDALNKAGLYYCLGNIIEEEDPDLAERILNGDSVSQVIWDEAWRHWDAHGIEAMLERTVRAGGVVAPEDRSVLEECLLRRLPGEGANAPAGPPPDGGE